MAKYYKVNAADEYVGIVFTTYDYGRFQKLVGNRDVTELRKAKIRRSVEANGQVFTVITVNEKMEVVDGQGRLEVFSEKGLPVNYVIVPGLTSKDCAVLNAATTAWRLDDYIEMYCSQGNDAYRRLKELKEKHRNIAITTIAFALCGKGHSNGGTNIRSGVSFNVTVKEGTFDLPAEAFEQADKKLTYAEQFLAAFKATGRKDCLTTAAVYAYDVIPNRNMLLDKWNYYANIKSIARPAVTIADALKVMED